MPIEYSITGFLNAAAVSLNISMDSFSRASSTEEGPATVLNLLHKIKSGLRDEIGAS